MIKSIDDYIEKHNELMKKIRRIPSELTDSHHAFLYEIKNNSNPQIPYLLLDKINDKLYVEYINNIKLEMIILYQNYLNDYEETLSTERSMVKSIISARFPRRLISPIFFGE